MGSYLTRDEILSAEIDTTDVEAFGGTILVREMPADIMERWIEQGSVNARTGEVHHERISRVEMAMAVIVDEDAEPILEPEDAEVLAKKGAGDILRCFRASMDITDWGSSNPTTPGATESDSSSD